MTLTLSWFMLTLPFSYHPYQWLRRRGLYYLCCFSDVELAELVFPMGVDRFLFRVHRRLLSSPVLGLQLLLRCLPAHEPSHILVAHHPGGGKIYVHSVQFFL